MNVSVEDTFQKHITETDGGVISAIKSNNYGLTRKN